MIQLQTTIQNTLKQVATLQHRKFNNAQANSKKKCAITIIMIIDEHEKQEPYLVAGQDHLFGR